MKAFYFAGINSYKYVAHALIWIIFYLLTIQNLNQFLPNNNLHFSTAKIYTFSLVNLLVLMLVPYFNYFILVPKFYFTKRFALYFAIFLPAVAIGALLMSSTDTYFLLPYKPTWVFTMPHIVSKISYIILFSLLASGARFSEELTSKQKQEDLLKQSKTEAELKWLKAQINPHFLFNTLNNIHSLAHFKSEETAPMIVKLSEMMRYLLYDCNLPTIEIAKEVSYLQNYLQLQLLKKRWKEKIFCTINNNDPQKKIEPLLFINFIENAFKHCNLDDLNAFIKIEWTIEPYSILFIIENTFFDIGLKDKIPGIGLSNVRERLKILYPSSHTLEITTRDNIHKVSLTILS